MRTLSSTLKFLRRGLFRLSGGNSKAIVIGTAHKVGSTWIFKILKDMNYPGMAMYLAPAQYYSGGTINLQAEGISEYFNTLRIPMVLKTHSYPPKDHLPGVEKVSIYRDPRDVVVSTAYFLGNISEEAGGWGKEYSEKSTRDKILRFLQKSEWSVSRLEAWFRDHSTYQIKYESLLNDPLPIIIDLNAHLGLNKKEREIHEIIEKNSFENMTGRKRGSEDATSFYRKGVAGDWAAHFDDDIKDAFQNAYDGRWNKLVVEMGYEKTLNW